MAEEVRQSKCVPPGWRAILLSAQILPQGGVLVAMEISVCWRDSRLMRTHNPVQPSIELQQPSVLIGSSLLAYAFACTCWIKDQIQKEDEDGEVSLIQYCNPGLGYSPAEFPRWYTITLAVAHYGPFACLLLPYRD